MSKKSVGPVKTRQEKLIDKAEKAIKEFWPPELDASTLDGIEKQNAEVEDNQSAKLSENNQDTVKGKKQNSSNESVSKTKRIKKMMTKRKLE